MVKGCSRRAWDLEPGRPGAHALPLAAYVNLGDYSLPQFPNLSDGITGRIL